MRIFTAHWSNCLERKLLEVGCPRFAVTAQAACVRAAHVPRIVRIPEKMVNVTCQRVCWIAPHLGTSGKMIVFAVT
jgi:hypothetical protein